MALARWEPFKELARIQDEFNRVFDDRVWRMRPGLAQGEELGSAFDPAVDIYEDAEGVQLTAELPGVPAKDVDVRVENGVLTLSGERRLEKAEHRDNYRRLERGYGTFTRSFTLPPIVDTDKVKAEFKDGVLRIHLPKKEESKPKSIKVKVD